MSDLPDNSIVESHIYADDITLTCYGNNLRAMCKVMQCYLEELNIWRKTWGMNINIGKTYMQYFTRRRIKCPISKLNKQTIKCKKVHKLLGLYYDSPLLKWKPHVDLLHAECLKRVDFLKVISPTNWGASCKILGLFYVAYIRAKIDYGSVLHGSSAASNLKCLDSIQNVCCRLILGARRSSPVLSLETEAHIPPLQLRRGLLSVKALIKLFCNPYGNANAKRFKMKNVEILEACTPVNCFISRGLMWIKLLNMEIKRVCTETTVDVPPWLDDSANNTVLTRDDSLIQSNDTFVDYCHTVYPFHKYCFTDGSKCAVGEAYVGCAMYMQGENRVHSYRLHPEHSVVFSELFAIRQALEYINFNTMGNYIIFSDSQAALKLITSDPSIYIGIVGEIKFFFCIRLIKGGKFLFTGCMGIVAFVVTR